MSSNQAGRRPSAGLLATLTTCLLASSCLPLLAACGAEGELSPRPQRSTKSDAVTTPRPGDQAVSLARFAIFNSTSERLPLHVTQVLKGHDYGLRPSRAQKLPLRSPARVWAVPARRLICLLSRHQSGGVGLTCDELEAVAAHGLAVTFLNPSTQDAPWRRVIVGIAADDIRQVIAVSAHGRSRLEVSGNIFIRRDNVPEAPVRLEGEHRDNALDTPPT